MVKKKTSKPATSGLPASSRAAVVSTALNSVWSGRSPAGVKVAKVESVTQVQVPATTAPPSTKESVHAASTEARSMVSLKLMPMATSTGTSVRPSSEPITTVGATTSSVEKVVTTGAAIALPEASAAPVRI